MHLAQIILEYLKTIKWPFVIGLSLLGFRGTLRNLLDKRLSEVNGPGVSAKFESAAREASELVDTTEGISLSPQLTKTGSAREIHLAPRSYYDCRTIGEHLRAGITVVLDLTQTPNDDAKRIVDFSVGCIFTLNGLIERIEYKIFRLTTSSSNQSPRNLETPTRQDR